MCNIYTLLVRLVKRCKETNDCNIKVVINLFHFVAAKWVLDDYDDKTNHFDYKGRCAVMYNKLFCTRLNSNYTHY